MRRLQWSYRRNGLLNTLLRVPAFVLKRQRADDQWHAFIKSQDGTFDEDYGVDTGGLVHLRDLAIKGDNWTHGVDYQAISADLFREMLGSLHIPHEQYVFVDLGSGKGKALLLAAAYPFRKIIGVEFSPELTQVAQRNIATYSGPRRCVDIEAVCADAALYVLPEEPLLIFLYNPFDEPVMRAVIENIQGHLQAGVRAPLVVYYNPRLRGLFSDPAFHLMSDVPRGDGYVIYEAAFEPVPTASSKT